MEYSIKTLDCGSFEMEYIVFGTGRRPLIIIPGVSIRSVALSAGVIADAYARFGQVYTVYVFLPRNAVEPGLTIDDMADDTAAAMQTLGIGRACVFGVSMGAMIAMSLALRYPRRVFGAVLGSTLARQNDVSREAFSRLIELTRAGDPVPLNREFVRLVYSDDTCEKFRDAFAATEHDGSPEELRRFEILLRACLDFDIYDRLPEIKCPLYVIGASEDKAVSAAAAEEIARQTGCRIYIYDGYGHAVYDEAPDYKDRIEDFFARKPRLFLPKRCD